MRFLFVFLMLLPIAVKANDMGGLDLSFGQGTTPMYGIDYEFNKDLPYLDVALSANQTTLQPYLSGGLQFEYVNIGLATSVSFPTNGSSGGQFAIGPELGFMYNLSKAVYVKENNNYMGLNGNFNFGMTLSLGLNF